MKKILSLALAIGLPSLAYAQSSFSLVNPLDPTGSGGGCQDIYCILYAIMNFLYIIGPIIAVIMILWGSFQIFTAGGDVEKVKSGKKTILYAIIGLVLILAGSGIDLIIQQLL